MNDLHGILFAYRSDANLGELTRPRNTCSLPFGGRYRLIAFMLSNCVNAGITDVGVVVHKSYQSLLDHLGSGKDWDLSRKHGGLRILPPFSYTELGHGEYRGSMEALAGVYDYLEDIRQDYVLLAWGGLRLAKHLTEKEAAPLWTFSTLLLLPTVILNGACWGQCDSVWGAFCLLALAAALENRPVPSLAYLALAFSFKLQAIFIIPLWCALWFTGRVRFRHLFVFPGVFALSMAPALLLGKPAGDILSVYLNQAGDSVSWQTINYNSPSVFALLPYQAESAPWVPKFAIALAFLFMLGVLALLFLRRQSVDILSLALAGAVLSLGIPFFLPYMHERYFFLGGVLLAVLACDLPSLAPAAVGAELASLGGYHAYLMKRYVMVLSFFGITWTQLAEGLLMFGAIVLTLIALWRQTS